MPRSRAYRVTFYLDDSFKNQVERLWNNLMALDVTVVEEHQKAGVIIAETETNDVVLLERIPGVAALRIDENTDHSVLFPSLGLRNEATNKKAKQGRQVPK